MKIFKKLLTVALIVMSVLAIALPAMAAETTVGGVNVRSGPSTSYGRVGDRIAQGSTCTPKFKAYGSTVSGSTSTLWYYVDHIRCACGSSSCNAPSSGYIHSSCLGPVVMIYNNAPTSKGDAFGPSTLRIGSKGIEVYNLQVILWENNCLGDRKTMNACDGVFGNATAQGVKDFQSKFYLELADGIVGTETKTELWNQKGQAFKYYGVKSD